MRITILLVLAVAVAGLASGGQNPHIRIYLDAVPPYCIHEIHPDPGDTFDVYVCFDCFGRCAGMRSVGFLLDRTFSGIKTNQVNLLGGPDYGDAEINGWTISSGPDCVHPEGYTVVAARLTYVYTGDPGSFAILPHPDTGRRVEDCDSNEDDEYCVHANLGICAAPQYGEPDCEVAGWAWCVVRCEPQGGANPVHPPAYWYDVDNDYDVVAFGFHVQVFDPGISNYSEFSVPSGWAGPDTVKQIGDEYWLSWCNPELDSPLACSDFRFGFENPNPAAWGHWTLTGSANPCAPFADIVWSSGNNDDFPDGSGYRVHVPAGSSPVLGASWGKIKALYRP